jgi:hypothetical protein
MRPGLRLAVPLLSIASSVACHESTRPTEPLNREPPSFLTCDIVLDLKASIWLQIGRGMLLVDKRVKAMDHTTLLALWP